MSRHNQPNGRPVHPECRGLLSPQHACTCDEAWRDWDGSTHALDSYIIAAQRNELRRWVGELDAFLQNDADDAAISGFWSNAEFLQTVKGG